MTITLLDWGSLALITLIAATIQATTGFGFGLLTVPLFLIILGSVSSIQVVIIVTLFISFALLHKLWGKTDLKLLARFAIGNVLGFPLGIFIYLHADLDLVKLLVALTVLTLLLLSLSKPSGVKSTEIHSRTIGVGIISGAMGSCLAMPGPAVLLYLSFLGASKDYLRATILILFIFSYAGALVTQLLFAGIQTHTWQTALILAPLAVLGAVFGHFSAAWISEKAFRRLIITVQLIAALYLLYSTAQSLLAT